MLKMSDRRFYSLIFFSFFFSFHESINKIYVLDFTLSESLRGQLVRVPNSSTFKRRTWDYAVCITAKYGRKTVFSFVRAVSFNSSFQDIFKER